MSGLTSAEALDLYNGAFCDLQNLIRHIDNCERSDGLLMHNGLPRVLSDQDLLILRGMMSAIISRASIRLEQTLKLGQANKV